MRTKKVTIKEEEEQQPPILPLMSTAEPPQYPPECLPYRKLSLATMWEMGIMEKWVEDFASCEELLGEVLKKVSLLIRNQETGLEKGSPLVRKKVGKSEHLGKLKTLIRGGGKGEKKAEESD